MWKIRCSLTSVPCTDVSHKWVQGKALQNWEIFDNNYRYENYTDPSLEKIDKLDWFGGPKTSENTHSQKMTETVN